MKITDSSAYGWAMAAATAKEADRNEEAKRAKEPRAEKKAAEERAKAQLEKQEKAKAEQEKYDKQIEKRREARVEKADAMLAARRSKPQDNSGELTRRLVAAEAQFEVRKVMGDAAATLVGLRQIAAVSGKEDAAAAKAAIKKLEKLLGRGRKKLRSLDQEDDARAERVRAERRAEKRRAKQIEHELRKKMALRKAKEMSYLVEQMNEQVFGQQAPANAMPPGSVSEAAITAKAEAMAASESVASGGGSMSAGGIGAASAPGGALPSSGGEASASGGEIAVSEGGGEAV